MLIKLVFNQVNKKNSTVKTFPDKTGINLVNFCLESTERQFSKSNAMKWVRYTMKRRNKKEMKEIHQFTNFLATVSGIQKSYIWLEHWLVSFHFMYKVLL